MTIKEMDRLGEFDLFCDDDSCNKRMRLRKGDLLLTGTPTLSPRVNWQTDTTTDPHRHYCPEHKR